ncbi:MAG: hypothetical protein K9J17_17885 [Flavobacteriales bacterium]|nr:hypothetical protein [Flavobacteriales bacterium]
MAKPFEYFFSDKELIRVLARKRASLAKKEHDRMFLKGLLLEKKAFEPTELLYEIFPPRSLWIRLKAKERRGKTAVDINGEQIVRTVQKHYKTSVINPGSWASKLSNTLDEIRTRALGEDYHIPKPRIDAHFKEEKDGEKIYRPIANYEYIDRIIIAECNKYLTQCLDPLFSENSYAFRSKEVLKRSYSHHDAIEDIMQYKSRFPDQALWVAEYDIKKFFDCVNHEVVVHEFDRKKNELNEVGITIDNRAEKLFLSYLDSYSFNETAKEFPFKPKSRFGWISNEELESVGSDSETDRIGVPQGGAISCLIANLIMDSVDAAVTANDDDDLFYARFCDDMVIIHPEKKECRSALTRYQQALTEIKLIGHDPKEVIEYPGEFWKSKSKLPYCWHENKRNDATKHHVPWLSFVGYQIKFDLTVRVRKSSLKKEIEKQIAETDKVVSLIKKNSSFRISERAIKFRLIQRLHAMSIGRKSIFMPNRAGKMCWTAGFRVLKGLPHVEYQLRHLDRKRGAQFARIDRALRSMSEDTRPDANPKPRIIEKDANYYGSPYSYHYQFKKHV